MARKNKIGLDYFSHDVEMFNDIKIKFIKAKHGLIGYAIFLRLLENIYKENGYFIQIDDKFNILFADDNKLDINVYINVLNDCINENLFNKEIYDKYKVLTSKRIQLNFLAGSERRKSIEFKKEFLLINNEFLENDNIKIIDVYINSENDDISTQKEIESEIENETEIENKNDDVKKNIIKKNKKIELNKESFSNEIEKLNISEFTKESLIEWFDYKSEIKNPIKTMLSITKTLNQLGRDFIDEKHLCDSIDFSIGKGYKGIFPKEIKKQVQSQQQKSIPIWNV